MRSLPQDTQFGGEVNIPPRLSQPLHAAWDNLGTSMTLDRTRIATNIGLKNFVAIVVLSFWMD
jgi:hypothetical protein